MLFFVKGRIFSLLIGRFAITWRVQLQQQSTTENADLATFLSQIKDKIQESLSLLMSFQARNSERVFNTGFSLVLSFSLSFYVSTMLFIHIMNASTLCFYHF